MAHKKKGQLTGTGERAKHLRPYLKGKFWKGERQATKDFIEEELESMDKIDKELYTKVDEILWNDWDPIGVNEVAPRNEYQDYTPIIFALLIRNRTVKEISHQLYEIETKTIGLKGNRAHCIKIAENLIKEKIAHYYNG